MRLNRTRLNISYSAYSVYIASQLQFYYTYIADVQKTDYVPQVYGDAGTAVHTAIEDFINKDEMTLQQKWIEYKIDQQTGMYGKKLSFQTYKEMYDHAIRFLSSYDITKIITEKKFEQELYGANFKGFYDIFIDGDVPIIIDWKTDSSNSYLKHKLQRQFYSWFHWKTTGVIPLCRWVYLKAHQIWEDRFTPEEMEKFDDSIQKFLDNFDAKGINPHNYDVGNWKGPFNAYKSLCAAEVERRMQLPKQDLHIDMEIRSNLVVITTPIPKILAQGIDTQTKFDLKDKYHMQQHAKRNYTGYVNLAEIGTVHLFNMRNMSFPIGLLDKVKKVCQEYADYYKVNVTTNVVDRRNMNIVDAVMDAYPDKLNTSKELRPYQLQAIDNFMKAQNGILHMATGSGKTFTAAEIIRQCKKRTLWIIDRKELLEQTQKVLQDLLQCPVGVIMGDIVQTNTPIVIATIQSLHSKKDQLSKYFQDVNMIVLDEFHKSAAETYQKVLNLIPNCKWRLGLTATPFRDDGKDPILFAQLGEIVYTISSQELIKQGYLVEPTIEFIRLSQYTKTGSTYVEDYQISVAQNEERNNKIVELIKANPNKKVIVLPKLVDHAKELAKQADCYFLVGSLNQKDREMIYNNFKTNVHNCLIITQSIAAEGLDIPDLDIVINAAANAGDVKSIQVLGRVLRTFQNKTSAHYYDFYDVGEFTYKHSLARRRAFLQQGYKVEEKQ